MLSLPTIGVPSSRLPVTVAVVSPRNQPSVNSSRNWHQNRRFSLRFSQLLTTRFNIWLMYHNNDDYI
jgi:hypothetical protein